MRTFRAARAGGVLLAACLVAGGLVGQAEARQGAVVSARIDGKRFKSTSRRLTFGQYGSLTVLVFGSKRIGRSVRSFGFGCVPVDLATATLPLTCDGNGNYQDVRVARRPSARAWGTIRGLRVTIEAFDGSRVRGAFSGTLDFGNENGTTPLGAIAVEDGRFDVPLR